MTKEYVCECGKVCTSVSSLGGHKRHCKVYLSMIGRLDMLDEAKRKIALHTS